MATQSAEPRPHPLFPEVDEDLLAETCLGFGVQYPHLWSVVRRYILRGDSYFRNGGLAVLSATTQNFPLDEAASVLEELFAKDDYRPSDDGTGWLSPAALRAVHAIATQEAFEVADGTPVRARMLKLLEEALRRAEARVVAQASHSKFPDPDPRVLSETIAAIKSNKPLQIDYMSADSGPRREPDDTASEGTDERSAELDRFEVEELIARGISELRDEFRQNIVSQTDLVTTRHGYSLLEQRLTLRDKQLDDKLASLEKAIDRFLGEKQVRTGERQVFWAKWAILLAGLGGIAAALVAQWIARQVGWI